MKPREHYEERPFETLRGLVLKRVEKTYDHDDGDRIDFEAEDGRVFRLHHHQECCESVSVEDICGELSDLVGSPITMAEEATETAPRGEYDDTASWTFYRIQSMRGFVTVRWHGQSTGYYSEGVDFDEVIPPTAEEIAEAEAEEARCREWARQEEARKAALLEGAKIAAKSEREKAERYWSLARQAGEKRDKNGMQGYSRLATSAEKRARYHETMVLDDQASYCVLGALTRWAMDDFKGR